MATIHQQEAQNILDALAKGDLTPDVVRETLNQSTPNWNSNASDRGYVNEPTSETAIVLARALHEALPTPFNLFPFDWTKQHGFGTIAVFLMQKAPDLKTWVSDALAHNAVVLANT